MFRRLEPTLENALFRIAQEALTNACRHSQSDRVRIELTQGEIGGVLEVRDWGCGFDQHHVTENRFGLEGIRERARLLGGTCRIQSQPAQGTVVRVEFPVMEQTED
jgi:two-component system sensor histidine kinase DegS